MFFNIFGMTILVDTLDDAVAYRKLLISEKKSRFPKIITRQGDILPSNGWVILTFYFYYYFFISFKINLLCIILILLLIIIALVTYI